jgi:precorrin-2 dehydrogenase/sirohydrochlorin ferrochelatase
MSGEPLETLRFLPVGLDVQGKSCLVIGGGRVGTRKAITLSRAGAIVTVVSPAVTEELAAQVEARRVRWVNEVLREKHVDGAFLVVAATDDESLNAAAVRTAARCGALVCDASSAERSQVIFGALFEDNEVTVAVFTHGRDPARARRTRDQIADLLGRERDQRPQP